MTVMMPVRCIGEICRRCDKLELEVDRYYSADVVMASDIYCANVQTCELIKQTVENEMKKEEQKNDYRDKWCSDCSDPFRYNG